MVSYMPCSSARGLILRDVRKSFGAHYVLEEMSLEVRADEFLCLLGPSGCGKSTLLKIIAGFDNPTTGEISTDSGEDLLRLSSAKRDIAMVFQNFALYPHMSVRDNIAMPLIMRRLTWQQRLPFIGKLLPGARLCYATIMQEVSDIAGMLKIAHLLDRKPSQLSGGQKQRVAIGRALIRKPSLFLMDEPLSSLDAALRNEMRTEIAELQRSLGITTLYVTHDQTEAMTMADRIVILMNGKVLQAGTPEEIFNSPSHLEVAKFIGSPPVNVLPAEAVRHGIYVMEQHIPLSLSGEITGRIQLAIRPECIRFTLSEPMTPMRLTWPVRILRVERTGHEALVHVATMQGSRLTGRLSSDALKNFIAPKSGLISMSFDVGSIWLFTESGERIYHNLLLRDVAIPEPRSSLQ